MNLDEDQFNLLIDNKTIYFDKNEKIYKTYFYDKLYPIANKMITEYTKSHQLDKELLSDTYKKEDYFKTLWEFKIDFTDNSIKFNGVSGYIDEITFKFDIDCVSEIVDIDKLKEYVNKVASDVKKVYIPCMQYPISKRGEWYEETILTYNINDNTYFTNKLLEECNFIKGDK